MKKLIYIVIVYFFFIIPVNAKEKNLVNIYLFHSNNCPHCKEEIKFLELLENKYSNTRIYKYEISDENNKDIINKVQELYNIELNSVPLTIIGDKYYRGYSSEKTPAKLIATIKYYSTYGYKDKIGEIIKNIELPKKEILSNQINIDKYIEQNSNYKIFLNINSSDINLNTTSSLLGIKSTFNIINLIALIGIIILLNKKSLKDQIILYGIYGTSIIIFEILDYITKENLNLIIILILILIFITIIKIFIKKNNHIMDYILIILIVGLIPIIKNIISISEITILNRIFELNLVTISNLILNIITYIFSYLLTNIFILIIFNKIISKVKKLVVK